VDKDIKLVLVKFIAIVAFTFLYLGIMIFYVGPTINQIAFGQQSAFDQGVQQQYGSQQYAQPYQDPYSQGYNQQYSQYNQQPYQQYGTPTYSPYGMQPSPAPYPNNTVLGFGIQEIVTALIAGGGATAYARRRTNSLENDKQLIMAEMLKDKQRLAELARTSYAKMPLQGNEITDAPTIKLDNLNKNIEEFSEKTAQS
jgi:hypothetical protein